MTMKNPFLSLFNAPKPILGMVHLGKLAGQKGYVSDDYVIEHAVADILAWQKGGIHGLIIENWQEDSLSATISEVRLHSLLRVVYALKPHIRVPFGVNVLNNDYRAAYILAENSGADFVQFDVLVDSVVSNFTYNIVAKKNPFSIRVDIDDVRRCAAEFKLSDLPILAGIHPKHYHMLDRTKTIEQSAIEAETYGVGGIVITKATGVAPTTRVFKEVKNVVTTPLGVGSGLTAVNAPVVLPFVDFAIVGTFAKENGITDNPVDIVRVKLLMDVVYDMANTKEHE